MLCSYVACILLCDFHLLSNLEQNLLMKEGMVWIDLQGPEPQYWFPSLMANQSE
jgi:hypothetical protein